MCDSNCIKLWTNWIAHKKSFHIKTFINERNILIK